MKRREFITLLGGAAAAWPLAARAQQAERMRRIGVLMSLAEDDPEMKARLAAFRRGSSSSDGRRAAMSASTSLCAPATPISCRRCAKELVALQPDVILAHSTPVAAALQQESRTIPIVFVNVSDPVGSASSQPGAAGRQSHWLLHLRGGIAGKWLAMLKEIAPRLDARRARRPIPRPPPTTTSCGRPRPWRRRSRSS